MSNEKMPFPELIGEEVTLFKEAVTKKKIKGFADEMVRRVDDGEDDPIGRYVQAKIMNEYSIVLMKGYKDAAIEEAQKHGKTQAVTAYGCRLEVAAATTKYDYSHDESWQALQVEMADVKERIKAREDLMRKAMSFSGVADSDGVEVPQAKPMGGNSESVRITIPK